MDQLDNIQNCIFEFRGQRVMIDRDLADLYGVPTKVLNQAVKRNMRRFPEDFMFQLNDEEKQELVTFCDRLGVLKHSGVNPKAFTQEGVAMLSGILNSEVAIETNIPIRYQRKHPRPAGCHQYGSGRTTGKACRRKTSAPHRLHSRRGRIEKRKPPICQLWHEGWLLIRKTNKNSEHVSKLEREGSVAIIVRL